MGAPVHALEEVGLPKAAVRGDRPSGGLQREGEGGRGGGRETEGTGKMDLSPCTGQGPLKTDGTWRRPCQRANARPA